jgi:hypothetical protein
VLDRLEQELKEKEESLSLPEHLDENLTNIQIWKARRAENLIREIFWAVWERERRIDTELYKLLQDDMVGKVWRVVLTVPLVDCVRSWLDKGNEENRLWEEHVSSSTNTFTKSEIDATEKELIECLASCEKDSRTSPAPLEDTSEKGINELLVGTMLLSYEDQIMGIINDLLNPPDGCKDTYLLSGKEYKIYGRRVKLSNEVGIFLGAAAILIYYCLTAARGCRYPIIDGLMDNALASISFQTGALCFMSEYAGHEGRRQKMSLDALKKEKSKHYNQIKEILKRDFQG